MIAFKNKLGGSKLFSIWWILALTLIALAIVTSTIMFYGEKTNIKYFEADILANKLVDCFSERGYLSFKTGEKDNFNIFLNCNLNEQIIRESSMYYLSIIGNKNNSPVFNFEYGARTFIENCKISKKVTAKNFPRCSEKSFYVLDENGETIQVKILAGSNYEGGFK